MTTPAVNIVEESSTFAKFRETQYNASGGIVNDRDVTLQAARRSKIQQRPASSTSPIRADGSRAPKAWNHRWCRIEPPIVGFRNQTTRLGRRTVMEGTSSISGNDLTPSASPAPKMAAAGGCPWAANSALAFPMSVRNAAVTKLRLKVIDDKASWGVTLGELRKTVQGIGQLSAQVLGFVDRAARSVRRTKADIVHFMFTNKWRVRKNKPWSRERRLRAEKMVTNQWLQAQFAIKPLLTDIEQSGEALSWLLFEENRPLRFTARAGATEQWSSTWSTRWPRYGDYWADSMQRLVTTVSCHFSVVYSMKPTTLTTFQQLGLTNVGAVVWELTAFSWVVDYGLQVGDWVNSMVKIDGLYDVEVSESRKARIESAPGSYVQVQPLAGNSLSIPRVKTHYDMGNFVRLVSDQLPGPAMLPSARNKLGLNQLANVLAVMSNLIAKNR